MALSMFFYVCILFVFLSMLYLKKINWSFIYNFSYKYFFAHFIGYICVAVLFEGHTINKFVEFNYIHITFPKIIESVDGLK